MNPDPAEWTIWVNAAHDLTQSGDPTWCALRDADDNYTDATLADGTVIREGLLYEAQIALRTMIEDRMIAVAAARGWTAARYDVGRADDEAIALRQMGEAGDVIAETLAQRHTDLWAAIAVPTGAEILAAVTA